MQLSIVLWLIDLKLRWSARFSTSFRKRIHYADQVIAIRTDDGRRARSFLFRDQGVSSCRGVHPDVTAELIWCDAKTAVHAMLSKNPLDTFSAMGRGDLTVVGNLQHALWFDDIAR